MARRHAQVLGLVGLLGCGARTGLGVPPDDDSTADSGRADSSAPDSSAPDSFAPIDSGIGRDTQVDVGVVIDSIADSPSISDAPDAISIGGASDFTVATTGSAVIVAGLFGLERGTRRLSFDGELLDQHAIFPSASGGLFGGVHVASSGDVLAVVTWEATFATGLTRCRWRALAADGSGLDPIVEIPVETCAGLHVRPGGFDVITQAKRFGPSSLTVLDPSGAFVSSSDALVAGAVVSRAFFDDGTFLLGWQDGVAPDAVDQNVRRFSAAGTDVALASVLSVANSTSDSELTMRLVGVGDGAVAISVRHLKGLEPTLVAERLDRDGVLSTGRTALLDTDRHIDGFSVTTSRGDVVVAWAATSTLRVQRFAADGAPRGSAVDLATSTERFGHVEVTPTPSGALVVYVREGELLAVPVTW